MTIQSRAYEEIISFIMLGKSSEEIVSFKPSEATSNRVSELLHKEKNEGISSDEKSELDHYMLIEHLMRLAKARAKKH